VLFSGGIFVLEFKINSMKYLASIILISLLYFSGNAMELKTEKVLNGSWKFNIGDESAWKNKDFNDSEWDNIKVPGSWEEDGYVGYNGTAWYRHNFKFRVDADRKYYYLVISSIDDTDEVYLNGKLLGYLGSFPPDYVTAYNQFRQYVIPAHWLSESNTLAIRVYDHFDRGGVTGDVRICTDLDENYLDLDLSGNWKFRTSHNKEWRSEDYNDLNWNKIFVPQIWEAQGYRSYNGYAWYRKQFILSDDLKNKDLYLVLGKIDDVDMVYFNGMLIGTIIKDKNSKLSDYESNSWHRVRAYKIPPELIKGKNTIAVAVYDSKGHGGIYHGPVGIMTKRNYQNSKLYKQNSYYDFEGFWKYLWNEFND
jgi:sialate O-acetylesterase